MTEYGEKDQRFIEAMEAAVAQRGEDFVYPRDTHKDDDEWWSDGACVYSKPDGTPACIIGLALTLAGETPPPYTFGAIGADAVLDNRGYGPAVQNAAANAQVAQDKGLTWGEALKDFRESLGEY